MRIAKLLPVISILFALAFVTVITLVFPLWTYIHAFLGTTLPVAPLLVLAGVGFIAYCARLLKGEMFHRWHLLILVLVDLLMLALLFVLLDQLGTERKIIARNAVAYLPLTIWIGTMILLLWLAPLWKPFTNGRLRAGLVSAWLLIALVWATQPWQFQITHQPVIFRHQDGISVVWKTNMPAVSWVDFAYPSVLGAVKHSQSDGLRSVSSSIQHVSLPTVGGQGYNERYSYIQAHSEGIRMFQLASIVKTGQVDSEPLNIHYTDQPDELVVAAFSDLHEQVGVYHTIARHIPWQEVNEVIYTGDLMNYVTAPQDFADAVLSLETGGRVIPRVFVRGNHEARGQNAAQLHDWLLPPGEKWYYTFQSGPVFFVVLDSGEDKPDSHPEYSGMVDFEAYHFQQAKWLKEVFASDEYQNAAYRVVLVHVPPFTYTDEERFGFMSNAFFHLQVLLKEQKDIDLMISGHIHEGNIWLPEEMGYAYPIVTCGGHKEGNIAALTARFNLQGIDLRLVDVNGQVIETVFAPKK